MKRIVVMAVIAAAVVVAKAGIVISCDQIWPFCGF